MGQRGRPRIGTPEEAAERRRRLTAERVRRLRERRRAERAVSVPAPVPAAPAPQTNCLLSSLVERIERIEKERRGAHPAERHYHQRDLQEAYAEARDLGFDIAALKEVILLRKMPERREFELSVGLYKRALGME